MLYATSEGVVLIDLKNRRTHYLVFDKRVVNFWGTEGGVGEGGGGEYFADISKDFTDLRLPEYPQAM